MEIKITKKTRTCLDLHRINPRDNASWNLQSLDGYYIISISQDVANALVSHGAKLDDPESIEEVVLNIVKKID